MGEEYFELTVTVLARYSISAFVYFDVYVSTHICQSYFNESFLRIV